MNAAVVIDDAVIEEQYEDVASCDCYYPEHVEEFAIYAVVEYTKHIHNLVVDLLSVVTGSWYKLLVVVAVVMAASSVLEFDLVGTKNAASSWHLNLVPSD